MRSPLVSIACITYNHAPYIRQCLDGFIMQQTDFDFEIVIHDDASTDGTRDVILEYCSKYPKLFRPILQEQNRYKEGKGIFARFVFPKCRGKYVAMCEGDDYWTDPLKLQKQVDFLENNPEYSVVVTRFRQYNQVLGTFYEDVCPCISVPKNGMTFDLEYYILSNNWITQPLTAVFTKDVLNEKVCKHIVSRDLMLFYTLLKHGLGFLNYDITGVYRVSKSGIYSMVSDDVRNKDSLRSIYDLYVFDKDKYSILYLKYYLELCVHGMGKSFFIKNSGIIVKTLFVMIRSFGFRYIYDLIKYREQLFADYRLALSQYDKKLNL